jgi:aryl-alcohol dehydrogenase-like predicted oxidoreductase
MNERLLGGTRIRVGEIGLGAWQLGSGAWGPVDESTAIAIVHEALSAGANFIDTAPGYGGGRSEEVLGRALKDRRSKAVICTKFGHTAEGGSDFSAAAIRPGLEASLRRLQTDHVDVLLLHNPPTDLLDGSAPQYGELEALKSEGKIRAYGVSVDWRVDLDKVLDTTNCQAVEILFNAFHQDPLASFARAASQGVGLIVKVPLDSGWLSGKYDASSTFTGVRDRWSGDQIDRRALLVREFRELIPSGTSVMEAALQYILAQPEVSTIIPGARTIEQVRSNCAASNRRLPADVVERIYKLWQREIENDPLPW